VASSTQPSNIQRPPGDIPVLTDRTHQTDGFEPGKISRLAKWSYRKQRAAANHPRRGVSATGVANESAGPLMWGELRKETRRFGQWAFALQAENS